jgi:hypothetical protein
MSHVPIDAFSTKDQILISKLAVGFGTSLIPVFHLSTVLNWPLNSAHQGIEANIVRFPPG